MSKPYIVRTIFLQNYFAPGADVASLRRQSGAMQAMVNAMKRLEIADKALESELNGFAERGYELVSLIPHPIDPDHPTDLMITVILTQET